MRFSKSQLRNVALVFALPVAAIGALSIATDNFSEIVAHGKIQQGHSEIDCSGCHTNGQGTIRQQLQANVSYAIGKRASNVNFGYQPVTSDQCLNCHERPNERHPIYRFNEPRFAEVRQKLNVNSCLGCHSEHEDARVSVSESVCSNCHDDLVLKNDPIDVSHSQLVEDKAWSSCLGCHDFHGNHLRDVQESVVDALNIDVIKLYFKNGTDPYGSSKSYKARADD